MYSGITENLFGGCMAIAVHEPWGQRYSTLIPYSLQTLPFTKGEKKPNKPNDFDWHWALPKIKQDIMWAYYILVSSQYNLADTQTSAAS